MPKQVAQRGARLPSRAEDADAGHQRETTVRGRRRSPTSTTARTSTSGPGRARTRRATSTSDPTAAFAIDQYSDDWRQTKGIQGRGKCSVVEGEGIAKAADLFGQKYPALRPGSTSADRLLPHRAGRARVHRQLGGVDEAAISGPSTGASRRSTSRDRRGLDAVLTPRAPIGRIERDDRFGASPIPFRGRRVRRRHGRRRPRGSADAPDDVELLRLAGRAGVETGADDAVDQLRKVAELQPDSADAWRDLGDALAAEGRTEEANDAFRKVLEIEPEDEVALTALGHTAFQAGERDAGVSLLEQVAARSSGSRRPRSRSWRCTGRSASPRRRSRPPAGWRRPTPDSAARRARRGRAGARDRRARRGRGGVRPAAADSWTCPRTRSARSTA